jgi:hypothetical protein
MRIDTHMHRNYYVPENESPFSGEILNFIQKKEHELKKKNSMV